MPPVKNYKEKGHNKTINIKGDLYIMKEVKDIQIKVRITPTEKEEIMEYCEASDLTISQFLRMAINEVLNRKED